VRNWAAYNAALVNRGNLTVWVDEEALQAWPYTGPRQRGAQYVYAAAAIQCVLTRRAVYHLALRAAQGLAESVFTLLQVSLPVPPYRTLSRRGARSELELSRVSLAEPGQLVLDSSGCKVDGEGEGKVRQHSWSKRRRWRKWHLAVAEATGEIVAAVAREAGVSDAEVLPDLGGLRDRPIQQVSAAGADDKRKGYAAVAARGATVTIPPRRAATIWQQGTVRESRGSGMSSCGRFADGVARAGNTSRALIGGAWPKPPSCGSSRALAPRWGRETSRTRRVTFACGPGR